jgi:demethylmenaquinone methyltransferase/2-methoxy-6-polyprenyl-1,4-benzoquinol methylase
MTLPAADEKRQFVERMFDAIAPRYDLLNQLMTFGIDRAWRRAAVDALALQPGARVLDLGCGTGDFIAAVLARGARPLGVDLSAGMLHEARRRLPLHTLTRADALALPLRDGSVDAVVSGFALRNLLSVAAAMRESARVLRRGGRIALLEVDVPRLALTRRALEVHFRHVVPFLGRLLSHGYAYRYLPASRTYLPADGEMQSLLRDAGFVDVRKRRLTAGAAQLVTAVRG